MNIFVLGAVSQSVERFVRASQAIKNFSVGCRTRTGRNGDERLNYPEWHIEADPEFVWLLGQLDRRFGEKAFYVHLAADGTEAPDQRGQFAGLDEVQTIEENLRVFMSGRSNGMVIASKGMEDAVGAFMKRIGAEVNLEQVLHQLAYDRDHEPLANAGHEAGLGGGDLNMEAKLHHSAKREQQALREAKALHAEVALLDKKIRRYRGYLRFAILPWVVLFFPIAVPLLLWKTRHSKSRAPVRAINRHHIQTTMQTLWTEGVDSACAQLRSRPLAVPEGAEALIRAYGARSDEEWLSKTNEWLLQHSPARLQLMPGEAPRFHRIRFSNVRVIEPQRAPISVIMPAFNAEDTVEASVMSILRQTWQDVELIVINDASTDQTGHILDKIASSESRLRVLHNPVNVGPYVSKNAALSCATGEYITGHDADDLALPERLESQYAAFVKNPDLCAAIGHMVRFSRHGLFNFPSTAGSWFSPDGILRVASISMMIRRADLLRIGYWDCVRFGADSEMIARVQRSFGNQFDKSNSLLMLCLNESGSLTKNSEFGISSAVGKSDIRKAYQANWKAWHAKASPEEKLFRYFTNTDRPFDAPTKMLVPEEDILAVRKAHRALT